MAIDKGNIKTSANYDVRAQKPMEARREKPRKVDLITKESWSYDGNTVYAHEGLQVWVAEERKTYVLKDLSKMFATDFSGWELMGTGAAAEIEVDTELSDTSENAIANSTVSRALAGKQERLMDGVNIKTINGQNILGRGNIEIEGGGGGSSVEVVDSLDSEDTTAALSANQGRVLKEMIEELPSEGTGGVAELMTELTYDELVSLRDSNSLVKGMKYRITDYETMTSQGDTQSAGHPFDIIVTALDENTLDEKASAIWSARDTDGYFAKSNLPAWDVRYCLDNNTARFGWAVSSSPSISFDGEMFGYETLGAELDGTIELEGENYHSWSFTLQGQQVYLLTKSKSPSVGDSALVYYSGSQIGEVLITGVNIPEKSGKGVVYRLIDEQQNDCPYDFKNIQFVRKIKDGNYDAENGIETFVYTFNCYEDGKNKDCSDKCTGNTMAALVSATLPNNVFLIVPTYNIIACYDNKFSLECKQNTMANLCTSNELGTNCYGNILGEQCVGNLLGDGCYNNTFEKNCEGNILGRNCHDNIFGRNSTYNVLGCGCRENNFGFACDHNLLGDDSEGNYLSLNCKDNKFGNNCNNNMLGGYCSYNEFCGNNNSLELGVKDGNSYFLYNRFNPSLHSIKFIAEASSGKVEHYVFGTIPNPSAVLKEISVVGGRNYETFVTSNLAGEIIQYTIDDIINK